MNDPANYPAVTVGPFEPPPRTFTDGEGRRIEIRQLGEQLGDEAAERAAIAEMYERFDPTDRAQGIPPTRPDAIRTWLDGLIVGDAVNVIAWDEDTVAGHAILVPDDVEGAELAIFVHQTYQGAGIGTRLIRGLLGAGIQAGIDRVWLTVERWNQPAIALYRGVGFETTKTESFDIEMAIRLDTD